MVGRLLRTRQRAPVNRGSGEVSGVFTFGLHEEMEATVTAIGSPPAGPLYDARRRVYYAKPVLRGWLHWLRLAASLVLGPLLLAHAHGALPITAVAVYSVSVSALFGFSALYHRGTWTDVCRQRLQRLDHAMIFFLIAGTATPVFLLTAPGPTGWSAWP